MTDDELQHMKQTVHELCGIVLRLQIDLNGKPDLRDQFAMAALNGALAGRTNGEPTNWIKFANECADAMMEARK
jgi:hypothetical protein